MTASLVPAVRVHPPSLPSRLASEQSFQIFSPALCLTRLSQHLHDKRNLKQWGRK